MSDFRKLLLAFAAVTLLAGIASAGVPTPAQNTTAQPLSVRDDASAIAPNIISIDLKMNQFFSVCGAGLQAPAFLVDTQGTFTTNNAQSLILGAPALPPAPNIAANPNFGIVAASGNMPDVANTAQAAVTIAGTPATTLNSNLNGTETNNTHFVAVDVGQVTDHLIVSNAFNAAAPAAYAGQTAVATHPAAPAQVARTAPINAGKNAG